MEEKKESMQSCIAVLVFGPAAIAVKMMAITYAFNGVIAPHFGLSSVTYGFVFVLLFMIEVAKSNGSAKVMTNAETIKASIVITLASAILFIAAYIAG